MNIIHQYLQESKSFKTPEQLLKAMDIIKYGFMTKDGKKLTGENEDLFDDEDYFWDNCRILQPDEVWKHRIGTCWDQSILAYVHLIKMGFKCSFVYTEPDNSNSHSAVFFEENRKCFRFEHSWDSYRGILGAYKSLDEGIKTMIKQMKKNDPKGRNFIINKNVNMKKIIGDYNLTPKKFLTIVGGRLQT